jgi:glucosamine--fructose-6-phosphate aminotransferase (isomerizing)
LRSLGNFPDPFIAEIAGQPDALRRAAAAAVEATPSIVRIGDRARRGSLVLTGMGSSYDAAYPAVTELAGRGIRVSMLDASELLHFRLASVGPDDVVVLVSQSGESAETVAVAAALRERRDRPLAVAVTNRSDSSLAALADEMCDTGAGEETGPSTMTFVAALTMLASIARATAGDDPAGVVDDAGAAAAAIERLLADTGLPDRLADWHGGRATTVILGRGGARAAAEMGALTLKESVGIAVESLQAAQFRHGPLEIAGPDLAAIVIATEPRTRALELGMAEDLRGLGAAVLVIGDAPSGAPDPVEIAIGELHRLLSPAAATVPIQLLAWRLAARAGRTPGAYVHASKVTTRE